MKGIYRLARFDPQRLSLELIRVQAELDLGQHHGAGVLAATNRVNKILKAFRIQKRNHHNGRRRYVATERK